jgi:hypothetical protein
LPNMHSNDYFTTEKLSIKFLEELPNYLFDIIAKKWNKYSRPLLIVLSF